MEKIAYLCRFELKRSLHIIIKFLLQILILVIVFWGVFFLYQKKEAENPLFRKIVVGIVTEDAGNTEEFVAGMVSSMESVTEICRIEKCTKAGGKEGLSTGLYDAVIYIPENMVEKIQTGINQPAEIYFSKGSGLNRFLFREIADCGVTLLSIAQAAVYSLDEMLPKYDTVMPQKEMEYMVSMMFLKPVMGRDSFFFEKESEVFFGISSIEYYRGVVFLILSLLSLLFCGKLFNREDKGIQAYLRGNKGYKMVHFSLSRWFVISLMTGAVFLFLTPILPGQPAEKILIGLGVGTFAWCIFSVSGEGWRGTQLLFFLSLMFLFLSGGIVPLGILPKWLAFLGKITPFYHWMATFFEGKIAGTIIWILIFAGMGSVLTWRKEHE